MQVTRGISHGIPLDNVKHFMKQQSKNVGTQGVQKLSFIDGKT